MPPVRNTSVPAALRPKTAPGYPPPPVQPPVALPVVPADSVPELHLALVVPDVRIQKVIRDTCYLVGPTTTRARVTLHVLRTDPAHPASHLDAFMRWALVESGLLPPDQVGLNAPVQVELGWAGHEKDTAGVAAPGTTG